MILMVEFLLVMSSGENNHMQCNLPVYSVLQ